MDIPRRCLSSMCPRCLDSYKELNPQLEIPIKLVVYYFSVRIHNLSAWVDQGTGLLHPKHVLIIYLTAYYTTIWYTTHRLLPFYQNLISTLLHGSPRFSTLDHVSKQRQGQRARRPCISDATWSSVCLQPCSTKLPERTCHLLCRG